MGLNQNIDIRMKTGQPIYFNIEPLEDNILEWHGNLGSTIRKLSRFYNSF